MTTVKKYWMWVAAMDETWFTYYVTGTRFLGLIHNHTLLKQLKNYQRRWLLIILRKISWFVRQKTCPLAMRHLTWLLAARFYILRRMNSILIPCYNLCFGF